MLAKGDAGMRLLNAFDETQIDVFDGAANAMEVMGRLVRLFLSELILEFVALTRPFDQKV